MESTVCCPSFDPRPWDGTTHVWADKPFLKDEMPQFLHIPLPGVMSKTITRMWEFARKHKATTEAQDFLLLTYDPSPWKSELYMALTKDLHDVPNVVKLSGNYISKVYDGSYSQVPKYIKDMEAFLKQQGKKAKRYYFYYTTCPKCAKKYGHNYIVLLSEI